MVATNVLALTITTDGDCRYGSHSLPPRPSHVLITLARHNAVKQRLRDQGLKPQLMRASEINAEAQVYFDDHARALLEEAWRKMQGCPDLMRFYEKEQRERQRKTVHILKHSAITCQASGEVSQ
jgi:sarcosine oxidase delta subunit